MEGALGSPAILAVSARVEEESLVDWRVAVGARPAVATLSEKVMDFLNSTELDEESLDEAVEILKSDVKFATDFRASEEYRKELAGVLLKRAIKEVMGV